MFFWKFSKTNWSQFDLNPITWPFFFLCTAWKVSQDWVSSGSYFPVFGPEKTPYLDTFHKMFSVQGCKDSYKEWVQRGCRPLLLQPRNLSHRAHHKIFRTSHGSVKKISFNLFRSNVSICFSVPQHFVANAAETVQGSFWAEHFWGTAYCIAFVKFVTVSAILSVAII